MSKKVKTGMSWKGGLAHLLALSISLLIAGSGADAKSKSQASTPEKTQKQERKEARKAAKLEKVKLAARDKSSSEDGDSKDKKSKDKDRADKKKEAADDKPSKASTDEDEAPKKSGFFKNMIHLGPDEEEQAKKDARESEKLKERAEKLKERADKLSEEAASKSSKKDENSRKGKEKAVRDDEEPVSEKKPVAPESVKRAATEAEMTRVVNTVQADANQANAPQFVADAALISLLRDVTKALNTQEELDKIEDVNQKAAVKLAASVLAKALDNPQLVPNRIIASQQQRQLETSMTAESWDSGSVQLSPNCQASVSALWAKKINGLLNISVAGNCGCRTAPDGTKCGEFVVVINAKSTMESGFDIQTQSDVNFWLAKVQNYNIDSTTCEGDTASAPKKSSALLLKSVLTERGRKFQAAYTAWETEQKQLAIKADEEKRLAQARAEEEKLLALQKSEAEKKRLEDEAKLASETKAKAEAEERLRIEAEVKIKLAEEKAKVEAAKAEAAKAEAEAKAKADAEKVATTGNSGTANEKPDATAGGDQDNNRNWDSPSPALASRMPAASATVLFPERAIAGQYVTVAVVNPNRTAEQSVELSFNGAALTTGPDGKVVFMVPEDAPPGPTLQVALSSRPDLPPNSIHVFQPLTTPTEPQVPRIDRVTPVVSNNGSIVIDGHNFEGIADRNRVIIDGIYDARVQSASPVQLKADLPAGMAPGPHSVSVSAAGLRSNPGQCQVVSVQVEPFGKDNADLKKLMVKVVGTQNKVRLKLQNGSPSIVKLLKGDEIVVVTSGGVNNNVTLGAQRLNKGNFNIRANVEAYQETAD